MRSQQPFEKDAYELITADKVHIPDHLSGHNQQGELDVWIDSGVEGTRFNSQLTVQGNSYPVRKGAYTMYCFILRDRRTGRYWFLDENSCGFWLQNESFFGARTYTGEESVNIR